VRTSAVPPRPRTVRGMDLGVVAALACAAVSLVAMGFAIDQCNKGAYQRSFFCCAAIMVAGGAMLLTGNRDTVPLMTWLLTFTVAVGYLLLHDRRDEQQPD
jgi:hypothetical protein